MQKRSELEVIKFIFSEISHPDIAFQDPEGLAQKLLSFFYPEEMVNKRFEVFAGIDNVGSDYKKSFDTFPEAERDMVRYLAENPKVSWCEIYDSFEHITLVPR